MNLADRYANNGPAIIDIGLGGADKYTNADVLGHSTAMLVAVSYTHLDVYKRQEVR